MTSLEHGEGLTSLAPGRVLNGKWTLGEQLGVGGAGSVFAAAHRNGTRAAVKVLHPRLAADEEQVARFLREGVIANQLGHPGVVAALDDDVTDDGLVYLVLELLEGTSLAERIEEHAPLDVSEALRIVDQVLDVLRVAHAKGIIHRDVKPSNVFLLRDGSVRLLDFGIARAPAPGGQATQMGAIFGSPGYMPPEQAKGAQELIDERTDVWSVAALLFTMLTGTRLHVAPTTNESLARAMFESCTPIRSVLPSLDATVAAVVDRGLAFDRDDRFSSAERMQGAVRFALRNLSAAPASTASKEAVRSSPGPRISSGPTSDRASPLRAIALATTAVMLVAFVASLAWLARSEGSPSAAIDASRPEAPAPVASTVAISSDDLPPPALPAPPAPPAAPTSHARVAPARVVRPASLPRPLPASPFPADPLGARR